MNILYIGPYRQFDYAGQQSIYHIDSIKDHIIKKDINSTLTCRPFYINPALATNPPEYVKNYEKNIQTRYDTIIQYCPVEFLLPNLSIKNIAIPILDPSKHTDKNYLYDLLGKFDWIMSDYPIINHNYSNNILYSHDIIDNNIISLTNQKINLGYVNNYYKFGFIGHYQPNKNTIYNLLLSFLTAFRHTENTYLVLFLLGTEQDQQELSKILEDIKKILKINNQINNIITIFHKIDHNQVVINLNTIDCFLSINEDIRYTLYEDIALKLNKDLISRSTISCNLIPQQFNNKYDLSYNSIIDIKDLIDSMIKHTHKNQKNSKTKNKQKYPGFGKMLCTII